MLLAPMPPTPPPTVSFPLHQDFAPINSQTHAQISLNRANSSTGTPTPQAFNPEFSAVACAPSPVSCPPEASSRPDPEFSSGSGQIAQAVAPAADGVKTRVRQQGNRIDIEGGQRSRDGANLFHSLSRFGLSEGQIANFLSHPEIRNILTRVVGGEASIINGTIQITGGNSNLFLLNPAGIVFGTKARLNVPAAFTATTATAIGFGNHWFNTVGTNDYTALVGAPMQLRFATSQPGSIINAGNLSVGTGQSLNLMGGTVINTGQLTAPAGQITIAAIPGSSRVRLTPSGSVLSLELERAEVSRLAAGIDPVALPALLTGGEAAGATGVALQPNGDVVLAGTNSPIAVKPGTALSAGRLEVSGAIGGTVQVWGTQVGLVNATVQANGIQGGGTVRLGGDVHGQGLGFNAQQTYISPTSTIAANALQSGNGGKIVVWADQTTEFHGALAARGATTANLSSPAAGGFAEVSGKQTLIYRGHADLGATTGKPGTLLLDPTNITIVAGSGAPQDNALPRIFANTAPPNDFTISQNALQSQTGTVRLEATNNITIANGVGLSFVPGGDITFVADADNSGRGSFRMDTSQTLLARGRNLTIQGDSLTLGNVDTSNIAAGTTSGGNIQLVAQSGITARALSTSAQATPSGTAIAGGVTINAGGDVTIGQITATATANTAGAIAQVGAITINSGGSITTEQLTTSAFAAPGTGTATATAGNITLRAARNVTVSGTNPIVANASTNATAASTATGGNVSLTADTGNVRFFSISSTGFAITPTTPTGSGGTISLQAPQGVIQGTATGNTVLTTGSTGGGRIQIQYGGGATNLPFSVGDAAANGTNGALNAGSTSLAPSQSFPVLSQGGTAPGTGPAIAITSVNTPPSLRVQQTLSGARENQAFRFTYADLAPTIADADADNTQLVITQVNRGTLTVNGVPVEVGVTTLVPGDRLVYTPPSNTSGTIANAFALQVQEVNGPANSAVQSVQIAVRPTTVPPVTSRPQPSPTELAQNPPLLPIIPPVSPIVLTPLSCSSTDAGVYTLEDKFTREFEEYLEKRAGTAKTRLLEACDDLNRVETQTGVKPAIVYVSFVPSSVDTTASPAQPRDRDQLELIAILPNQKPIYKRVSGSSRAEVLRVARQFTIALTDPTSRDTDAYLTSAQTLYQWFVQPLDADLQTQKVKNLVFILDAGLRSVPIAALHDGQQFLVEKYSLGLMPSLSITDTRYRDLKDSQILAMGAANFQEQKPLPAVPIELASIFSANWQGETYLNQGFTLNNLRTRRQQQPFGIIHLATHAEFNPGSPENSYIQLWDTKLRLDQVRQLGWNDPPVQLLVLSACRTALGDTAAELGFAGLAYQTGVRSVLASLWAVDDAGTLALMTEFYRQLKTAPIRAAALRQAQLAMIRGQVRVEQGSLVTPNGKIPLPPELAQMDDRDFASPFYWSAFTMIGNPW